jgi:hypothetical protein
MDGSLLLAGTSSIILNSLARTVPASKVLVATEDEPAQVSEDRDVVQWNRRSPIAARTLVLHALTSLGTLDSVLLVYSVDRSKSPFHEQSAARFEERVDRELKGYLFLVRELLIHFVRTGVGTLDFVLHDPQQHIVDPVASAAAGAFRSMVQSLFVLYQNEPILLRGFSSESEKLDEFVEFIWSTIREKGDRSGGRWNRFTGRAGLFSFGRGSR